jgi:hypothetical protein
MHYLFASEDGWEDYCSSEEEHWELTKLYTMAGTPYTVSIIEDEETMEGKYSLLDSHLDSHPSLSAQQRNPNLK